MRIFVIAVALLAGLKVWTQDRIVRGVMGDAIIVAYRDRAELACQKLVNGGRNTKHVVRLSARDDVSIGNPNMEVSFWEFDSPLWNVRYRHPHVMMTAQSATDAGCAFDVVSGLARVNTVR